MRKGKGGLRPSLTSRSTRSAMFMDHSNSHFFALPASSMRTWMRVNMFSQVRGGAKTTVGPISR